MHSRPSLLALIVLLAFAGCAGGGSSASVTPTTGTSGTGSGSGSGSGGTTTASGNESMTISLSGLALVGQSGSFPLSISIKDASGNAVTGSLPAPITLTSSDETGTVTVSPATISNASTPVTLTYSGAKLSAPVTIGATTTSGTLTVSSLTFQPNADAPLTPGTTASYTSVSTTTQTYPTQGTPSSYTSNYNVTVVGNAAFNGLSNLIDEHTVYTEQPAGTTSTEDTYFQLVALGATVAVNQVGAQSTYSSPTSWDSSAVGYAAPFETVDILPHKSGNTWSALFGSHDHAIASDGITDDFVSNADGSGANTISSASGSGTTTTNADGTVAVTSSNGSSFSFGAPITVGGQSVIPYTTQQPGGTPVVTNVPNWLPNGTETPISTATKTDKGSVAIPSQCALSPSIATNAEDLHTDYTHIILYQPATGGGEYFVTSDDQYVAQNVGLVCELATSTAAYYNSRTDGAHARTTQTVTVATLTAGGFAPLAKPAR